MSKNPETVLVEIPYEGTVAAHLVQRYPDGDCRVRYEGREYVAPEVDPEDDDEDEDEYEDDEE